MICPFCKEEIQDGAIKCKHCGSMLVAGVPSPVAAPPKSRITAGVLALLLGGIGIHKFYVGSWGWGILYVVFFWTWIPALLALIEAIRYFTLSEDEFQQKVQTLTGPFGFLW